MTRAGHVARCVEDEAAFWFARLQSDKCSLRDRRRFDRWLAEDPAHAEAYGNYDALWSAMQGAAADPAIVAMRHDALALRAPARELPWDRLGALAAAIALFLLAGLAVLQIETPDRGDAPVRVAATASADAEIFRTRKEQRSTITLSDGSVVELNADSMIQVRYSAGRRDIQLLRGQALFDVARDEDRPFRVEAGDRRIVALGTSFDVRVRSDELRVTLIEGEVSVEPRSERPDAAETRRLAPGEQLVVQAKATVPVTITPVDLDKAMSWRSGRIIFADEPLSVVLEEVNRYSVRQVEIADPALGDLRVSGVFRTGSVDNFTSALALSLPVESRLDARRNVIMLDWSQHD